jgi:hypothetical protein
LIFGDVVKGLIRLDLISVDLHLRLHFNKPPGSGTYEVLDHNSGATNLRSRLRLYLRKPAYL